MKDNLKSSITIKSNIALKSKGKLLPIDLRAKEYTDEQQKKILLWAERVCDDDGNPVLDECYKGCKDCLLKFNNCRRPKASG